MLLFGLVLGFIPSGWGFSKLFKDNSISIGGIEGAVSLDTTPNFTNNVHFLWGDYNYIYMGWVYQQGD